MMDDQQLVRAVGRIEGMLTAMTAQLTQAHADNNARFVLMEARLSEVEAKMSKILGVGAAVAFVTGLVAAWIRSLFSH